MLVAIAAWRLVPDSPGTAHFLTTRERTIAETRLHRNDTSGTDDKSGVPQAHSFVRREIWTTLKDPKCYITAVSLFPYLHVASVIYARRLTLLAHVPQLQHRVQ